MHSIGEIVRKQETDYRTGNAQISKYVNYSMHDIIEQCHAYINSKHLNGETDDLGRDRVFANIVVALRNIYFRATDTDTKNIKFRASNSKEVIPAILAKHFVREYMRKTSFRKFLNKWGLTKATYGSASIKAIESEGQLYLSVTSWLRHICDSIEYDPNPKIDLLELTQGQLRRRVQTHGYDPVQVDALISALTARETIDKNKKDNKSDYIKLYEMHLLGTRAQLLAGQRKPVTDSDQNIFVQQMHVISTVEKKEGRKTEYQDFTVFAAEEREDPYMLTHLIEEDGRSLAIGPVENALIPQWMFNHSMKLQKDTLDLANMLVWQTPDPFFVGQNMNDTVQSGDILVHAMNMPLTKVDTSKADIQSTANFGVSWKMLAAEMNGVSEAMLGVMPPSGTSGTQLDSLLRENYSLFQTITENAGNDLIEMFTRWILPFIKRNKLNHKEEIAVALDDEDVTRIDAIYLKDAAIKKANKQMLDAIDQNLTRIQNGKGVVPIDASGTLNQNMSGMQESLSLMGNTRYFKPSDLTDDMWADVLKDFEWSMEIDVTGEESDMQEVLTAYAQALPAVMNPAFQTNDAAKALVSQMISAGGGMNAVQLRQLFGATSAAQIMAAAPRTGTPSPLPASASTG